jgi:predicted nucleotidyltransferase
MPRTFLRPTTATTGITKPTCPTPERGQAEAVAAANTLTRSVPIRDLCGRPYSASIGDRRNRAIAQELDMPPARRIWEQARLIAALMGRGDFVKQNDLAERVVGALKARGIQFAVIGGHALTAYGYIRATRDVDLLTSCELDVLPSVAEELRGDGIAVVFRPRGDLGQDDLDGTITAGDPNVAPVQVVNIKSSIGRDALESATTVDSYPMPVVSLEHLIALKVKANGHRDRADVIELLTRHNNLDRDKLRQLCTRYRASRKFDSILAAMAAPPVPDDE